MTKTIPVWQFLIACAVLPSVICLIWYLVHTSKWYIKNVSCNAVDCENCPIEDECDEEFKDDNE